MVGEGKGEWDGDGEGVLCGDEGGGGGRGGGAAVLRLWGAMVVGDGGFVLRGDL